jgi:peptide/nickel transport system substrate-binding protein
MEANADYWNTERAPNAKQLTYRFLPEASTRVAALQAGEVDIIQSLPPDLYDVIDADPNLDSVWVTGLRTPFFRFFPESPKEGAEPLKDVRVRQAINHAINVDALMEGILGGRGTRIATLMTPALPGFDASIQPYEYNPDRARELLAEAGYADGFTVQFDTWSSGPAPQPVALAEAAANDLAQVGITANVTPIDQATSLQNQYDRVISPIHLWSWGGAEVDCRDKHWGVFHPGSSANFIQDDVMVDLIENRLDKTTDPEERAQVCSELQQRVHDEALIVPLFAQPEIYGKASHIDWTPRADELIFPWEIAIN